VPALQFNRVQGSGNASSRSSSETVCAVSRSLRKLLAAILLVCEKNSVKHECDEGWLLRNQALGTGREKSNSDLNPLEINTAENLHRTASQTSNDLLFALHGLYVPKPLNYDVICQSVDEVQDTQNAPAISMGAYLDESRQARILTTISIYSQLGTSRDQTRLLYMNAVALLVWQAMGKYPKLISATHRPPRSALLVFGIPFSE
jgi:hypothetical protein